MKYYIYILYSPGSDKYYVGQTHNVEERLKDHNEGQRPNQHKKYTYKHRPWQLCLSFSVGSSRSDALKIERYIKSKKSRKFIKDLISCKDDREGIADLVRVPISSIRIHQ
ncbi:MAG: GIY-YIG nuclease family protein [Bacteroidota bacterium]